MLRAASPVLYVEDNPCFSRAVLGALALGPVIEHAESVRAARDALGRGRRRLIITDVRLRDGTGFDVLDAATSLGGVDPTRWYVLRSAPQN